MPAVRARAPRLEIRSARVNRRLRGLAVELQTDRGTVTGLEVALFRGRRRVAQRHVARVGTHQHRVLLRVDGKVPLAGHYTVIVRQGHRTAARRTVAVRRTHSGTALR